MQSIVLFGAGASKGSEVNNDVKTPPLGAELFNYLSSRYPKSWGILESELFVTDFEVAMANLVQSKPDCINQLQREMAMFLFEFQPTETSLYQRLIHELYPYLKTISFATLNYDILLERCILKTEIKPVCARLPQFENREVEICFPHGCSHFWMESFRGSPGSIRFHPSLDAINGPVRAYGALEEFQDQFNNNPLPPVISCFDIAKTTPTAKEFIQKQRERLKELIEAANLVIVIGIRIRDHDKHIWEPLKTTQGKIIYCSGQTGAREFEQWQAKWRASDNDTVLPGYFKTHFEDIVCAIKETSSIKIAEMKVH